MTSGIKKTKEQIKQKLSFKDYGKPNVEEHTSHHEKNAPSIKKSSHSHTEENSEQKDKKSERITIYLTEECRNLLNEVYIKGLRENNKRALSDLMNDAVKMLYEKEIGSRKG